MSIPHIQSLSIATILNANYSTGMFFSSMNVSTYNECMCSCILHPHCLSISSIKTSSNYICQLYATYPTKSSQLLSSSTSNVSIYADRVLNSVYINNGTQLFNPTSLFINNTDPWIPVFKLYTGNNESFLWFNSSNSTTLIDIPKIIVNQTASHWYSILISQWNNRLYTPNQVLIYYLGFH
jgi:hypothetical protein